MAGKGKILSKVYGKNVERVVRILAKKGAIEFRKEEPTAEEAVTSDKIIITPRYSYLPATLVKRVSWANGINHKKIKKELAHNGKIDYVAVTDPKLGEINRAYIIDSNLLLRSIYDIVGVPSWFSSDYEEPAEQMGIIARIFMMSLSSAEVIGT